MALQWGLGLRFLSVAVATGLTMALCLADGFERRHADDLRGQPADMVFRVEPRGGQRVFRVGERIPLTLEFSSRTPGKYRLNSATYDRSGRLPTEEFVMEQSVTDPYADYFGSGVMEWLGGGLRGIPVLDETPVRIELELNQWFRFEKPGRYRFYVKSHRLTTEQAVSGAKEEFAAVSKVIEIEIRAAERAWELGKIAEIRGVFPPSPPPSPQASPEATADKSTTSDKSAAADGGSAAGESATAGKPSAEDKAAVEWNGAQLLAWRELEYLGSSEAVEAMFATARETGRGPVPLSLFAARDRQRTVAAFDAYLADPEVAIGVWDLRARAAMAWLAEEKPELLPVPQSWAVRNWELVRKEIEGRQARYGEVLRATAMRLIPAVKVKTPAQRKASVEAVARVALKEARAAGLVPAEDYGMTRAALVASFGEFEEERQLELLEGRWDLVRGPEMIPALEQVLKKAKPRVARGAAMPLNVWGSESGVAIAALQRLAQLSPEAVARVVQEDLATAKPRFAGYALRELPAQSMPAADEAMRASLRSDFAQAMPIVARFGSKRLLSEVRQLAETNEYACETGIAVVSYFARVLAEADARQEVHTAMEQWGGCRKRRGLLAGVADITWSAPIQAEALAALEDEEPEVAKDAAEALAAHGGPEVEDAIWKRLERWREGPRGQAGMGGGTKEAEQLGRVLFDSIGRARAWVLDEARRARLVAMCGDERCRSKWRSEGGQSAIRINVANGGWLYPARFSVEMYASRTLEELKQKLGQYPAGTVFCWGEGIGGFDQGFTKGQKEDMYRELAEIVAGRGMRMGRCGQE